MKVPNLFILSTLFFSCLINIGFAHNKHSGGIQSKSDKDVLAPFDIIHSKITTSGQIATFHMAVSAKAGINTPTPTGKLAGSHVFSYVWPTTIDSYEVGFDKKAGILALAVTSHPDFDDISRIESISFDGVTAGLRVNQSVHAPLLCVINVMDIASGDLSLPGQVNQ